MEPLHNPNGEIDKIVLILSRLKDEYDGSAAKNHRKLALLDLTIGNLPKDVRESLEICAKFAQVLGLEYLSENSLMIRNSEMLLADHEAHEKRFDCKLNAIKVKKVLKDLQDQTALIKRICGRSLDDNETLMEHNKKKVISVAFMEEKLKGYHEKVKRLDATNTEIEPKVNLKEVIECNENIKSMDDEMRNLQLKLDRYRNLPPNMILAKEKLKEEKLTLEKCEQELDNFIENYVQIFK